MTKPNDQDLFVRRASLILGLRQVGVRDRDVLAAIETVPREAFVPAGLQDEAYEDRALPIECGQTISAPSVVAIMTEALQIEKGDHVLEIGTGSGYQTAILAKLARRVTTIERHRELYRTAERRFDALGLRNITAIHADGNKGWERQAPFDAIMVTAAAEKAPTVLIKQLDDGGRLVVPIGSEDDEQRLTLFAKQGERVEVEDLGAVRFVPMRPGTGGRS